MCTAISFLGNRHYFGRTLDIACPYAEQIVITPRNAPLPYRRLPAAPRHHALIGMATLAGDYPLYYDAVNEHGLAMAGLSFPRSCRYFPPAPGRDNVTPFELIPWVLGQCATAAEAETLLARANLLADPFSPRFPLTPLHWMVADATRSLAVESTEAGLQIYHDPVQVLTNEPPFPLQSFWLNRYLALTDEPPENTFDPALGLAPYSEGMGALGLPGDLSSPSRFVRAAFARSRSAPGKTVQADLCQMFRLLGFVSMPPGCVRMMEGGGEYTYSTVCCDTAAGIYYYTTYLNPQLTAVSLRGEDPEGQHPIGYPLRTGLTIPFQNG